MSTMYQKYQAFRLAMCSVAGRKEEVVICDAQKRGTGYAYLVINNRGEIYVAWENAKIVGVFVTELVRKSFRDASNDANIDVKAKKFVARGYVVA